MIQIVNKVKYAHECILYLIHNLDHSMYIYCTRTHYRYYNSRHINGGMLHMHTQTHLSIEHKLPMTAPEQNMLSCTTQK